MATDNLVNTAAWQTAAKVKPLKVGPGPDQNLPAADEVVIKVGAAAINPVDWKMQDLALIPVQYPYIWGSDVAGEIVRVGEGVTRFKAGDRVMGHALGLSYGGARHGGFQTYTTCRERVVSKIPDHLTFSQAAVLPLSLSTSICGLFENLQLEQPRIERKPLGKTVLIWGGSSSMGSTAIQLAVAAGYEVITTASAHNHPYVESLGAAEAFDQSRPGVVEALISRLKKSREVAGVYDSIGTDATKKWCGEIISRVLGGGVLPTVNWPAPTDLPEGVNPVVVFATNPGIVPNHVGVKIWQDFVPLALEAGVLQPKPDPQVLSGGLNAFQEAMEMQKRGVSAKKIVVEL